MTSRLTRVIRPAGLVRATPTARRRPHVLPTTSCETQRALALVRNPDGVASDVWFNSSAPYPLRAEPSLGDKSTPDERTLKLGKSMTVRILHERLPTLLASPLPQDILSPQISLNLFPSTHPHLPTVSGRIAYTAALWTAPVAWGRIPVLGNVRLQILSERMARHGGISTPSGFRNERLIVRWKTCGKTSENVGGQFKKIAEYLRKDTKKGEEFCGLFLFEFDEEGRIVAHTIEHVDEGGSWDKTARVISVTDWLLGKAWGKKEEVPGLALGYCEDSHSHRRGHNRNR